MSHPLAAPLTRPILEVCVDTAAGLTTAVQAGADRIELCAALPLAGLTPSVGLMALARTLERPTYVMIRPRAGDFAYSRDELDVMLRDIDLARENGLAGVVLGAAHPSGELDEATLERLLAHATGMGTTLHRVFDATPDRASALQTAIDLGFQRVMTSGGAATAMQGADEIAALVAQAKGRTAILPGSGVTASNVVALITRTGVQEVHASCSVPTPEPTNEAQRAAGERLAIVLGAQALKPRDTNAELVAGLLAVLQALA